MTSTTAAFQFVDSLKRMLMDDSYSSEQDQESEEGAVQEEEIEVDGTGSKDEELESVGYTFGGLLENGQGTLVGDYTAVNQGLNRFIQPKYWAALLFAAHEGKMPWISQEVPQKVQANSVFVVNLNALRPDQSIVKDGLGAWIQNCGKVTNYFVWEYDNATEVKQGSRPDAIEFVRRIDKSGSFPAYTRVIVQAPALGLAAIQYFYKGTHEQPFDINLHRPKKSQSVMHAHNGSLNGLRKRNRASGDREVSDAVQIIMEPGSPSSKRARPPSVSQSFTTEIIDGSQIQHLSTFGAIGSLSGSLTEMATLLRNFLTDERKLRREDMELRRKERAEDRAMQREELEVRKQEVAQQKTRLQLDQQKWELDRKEREVVLSALLKKETSK